MQISQEQYNKLPEDLRRWFDNGVGRNTHPT